MRTRRTYDPFGWRLEELAEPGLNPFRRAELLEGLLVAEAEEIAAGRRHLTIVHGEPADMAEAEELNDFYDRVEAIVDEAEWGRLAGGPDSLTVTLAERGCDEWLAQIADLARRRVTEHWPVIEGPYGRNAVGRSS
jgi:hypothetical protein